MYWIECKKEMPMSLEVVLAIYWIAGTHRPRFLIAEYIPSQTVTMRELLGENWSRSGCTEFDDDKENKIHWAKQGWWAYLPVGKGLKYIRRKIKYWMRLPKPPYSPHGRDGMVEG